MQKGSLKMLMFKIGALSIALALPALAAAQNETRDTIPIGSAPQPTTVVSAEPQDRVEDEKQYKAMQRAAYEKAGGFGLITLGFSKPEKVMLCDTIAQGYPVFAAQETDREQRIAKFNDVWRFEQRLKGPLAEAEAELGQGNLSSAKLKSNQAMNLLSMVGDPLLEASDVREEDDLMHMWAKNLAFRCGQMLDEWGIAQVSGEAPADYIKEKTRFRFRGADYAATFKDTDLAPYAREMCGDGDLPDFSDAPLDQRGLEGMSLLDWAIECDDKVAFEALIVAGADLSAIGLFEDPPLVRTATEKRLWYLTKLLDAGVNPDAMGRTETALRAATSDYGAMNYGGDTRAAYNLLRERGASLNFPSFRESMWDEWGLHGRNGGWNLILEHWDEFESDPVELASLAEEVLKGRLNWLKDQKPQARKVKKFLIEQYGVCFPVGNTYEMAKDERGFVIQPDCPTKP